MSRFFYKILYESKKELEDSEDISMAANPEIDSETLDQLFHKHSERDINPTSDKVINHLAKNPNSLPKTLRKTITHDSTNIEDVLENPSIQLEMLANSGNIHSDSDLGQIAVHALTSHYYPHFDNSKKELISTIKRHFSPEEQEKNHAYDHLSSPEEVNRGFSAIFPNKMRLYASSMIHEASKLSLNPKLSLDNIKKLANVCPERLVLNKKLHDKEKLNEEPDSDHVLNTVISSFRQIGYRQSGYKKYKSPIASEDAYHDLIVNHPKYQDALKHVHNDPLIPSHIIKAVLNRSNKEKGFENNPGILSNMRDVFHHPSFSKDHLENEGLKKMYNTYVQQLSTTIPFKSEKSLKQMKSSMIQDLYNHPYTDQDELIYKLIDSSEMESPHDTLVKDHIEKYGSPYNVRLPNKYEASFKKFEDSKP